MGTYTEDDAVERVWMLLRDYGSTATEQLLTDDEIKAFALREAEQTYSRIAPLDQVEDLVADGTSYLDLPAAYVDGFSSITAIETPVDRVPPEFIDARDYRVARDGTGALRFVFLLPPTNGETVRVLFTGPRVIAPLAADTTIRDGDFSAFAVLAASISADSIAAKYARTSEPALSADAINYRTRAQEWRDIAKRLWQRWESAMGIGSSSGEGMSSVRAASGWANWDTGSQYGSRLTHPRQ